MASRKKHKKVCFPSTVLPARCKRIDVRFWETEKAQLTTGMGSRTVIRQRAQIFDAWSEEQWVNEGAQVDVSLICFGNPEGDSPRLNGVGVDHINPDLTSGMDLTTTGILAENVGLAVLGIQKSGPFDVPGTLAREWMAQKPNVNDAHNWEVLKPFRNGDDLTDRPRNVWLIDLPLGLSKTQAKEYASIYKHLDTSPNEDGLTVRETPEALGDRAHSRWWEPHWPRPEMRERIQNLSRYAMTARTSKHHIIEWQSWPALPDENLIVFLRDDWLMFGVLQSRFHAIWALRKGSDLEDRPRYTHTSVTATFPFPVWMTPAIPYAVARTNSLAAPIEAAAEALYSRRQNWLWPAGSFVDEYEAIDF